MRINWVDVFINWFPMLLLIAVWIFFFARMRGGNFQTKYQTAYMEDLRRQVAALERIAAALEARKR
jgi:ATP-dependent Zn protease